MSSAPLGWWGRRRRHTDTALYSIDAQIDDPFHVAIVYLVRFSNSSIIKILEPLKFILQAHCNIVKARNNFYTSSDLSSKVRWATQHYRCDAVTPEGEVL